MQRAAVVPKNTKINFFDHVCDPSLYVRDDAHTKVVVVGTSTPVQVVEAVVLLR